MRASDHYEVLGLSTHRYDVDLPASRLRDAYKRALLLHHPDKEVEARRGDVPANAEVTVDDVAQAYKTLSNPEERKQYDQMLRMKASTDSGDRVHHTGLEIVDLEDLEYDDGTQAWVRPCRCGSDGGFIVTEDELERQAKDGELVVGCKGCSLWIKVLFAVED